MHLKKYYDNMYHWRVILSFIYVGIMFSHVYRHYAIFVFILIYTYNVIYLL